jgi:hypothetical protein
MKGTVERKPQPTEEKRSECHRDLKEKRRWIAPRLEFVKPKLTSHGRLEDVTGFFGSFTP